MPNRRKIKKQIKQWSNAQIEDAYIEIINNPKADEKKLNKRIDDLVESRFQLLAKVSQYPRGGGKDIKAHFNQLRADLSKDMDTFS